MLNSNEPYIEGLTISTPVLRLFYMFIYFSFILVWDVQYMSTKAAPSP